MKKINNKGISIVEIIISISLIAVILVFLMSVLITVRNEDEKSRTVATLLMNQALLTKEIQKDFIDYELLDVVSCSDGEAGIADSVNSVVPTTSTLPEEGACLKLIFNEGKTPDNIGYLLYYTYGYSNTGDESKDQVHAVGYRRGTTRKMLRETTEAWSTEGSVVRSCTASICVLTIDLPVLNDGEDYGIHLSYSYKYVPGTIYTDITNDLYHFNIINK